MKKKSTGGPKKPPVFVTKYEFYRTMKAEILERVLKGEAFIVTNYGRPIMKIEPPE